MRTGNALATLCVCCFCLAAATTSRADFVGVVSEFKLDAETADLCGAGNGPDVPFPLTVCNVSIQFDEDDDRLLSIFGSDLQVMSGANPDVFYHHPFGGAVGGPYDCSFLAVVPDLICDSYVTIGEKCVGLGGTTTSGDFDSGEFNNNGHLVGCWFNNNPPNGLGDAFGDINPDGKVLILQVAVAEGLTLEGTLDVFWQNVGNPLVFQETKLDVFCGADCGDCPTDVNGDGETGPFDLATLLAAWGPIEAGNCLDANGDGDIGPFDLASLLAAWGPCP